MGITHEEIGEDKIPGLLQHLANFLPSGRVQGLLFLLKPSGKSLKELRVAAYVVRPTDDGHAHTKA